MDKKNLGQKFAEYFKGQPRIYRAPGRVNLIGEHTDYNDGFVFPMAINRYTYAAINRRSDDNIRIWSENIGELRTINLKDGFERQNHWSDYVLGIFWALITSGIVLKGADLYIESEVPVGSGLSSSAALEVAIAYGLLSINNQNINKSELAILCQKAENDFVGMKCGIMDQFIACNGIANHALFLDCRTLEYEHVPLSKDNVGIVVCNTMVKHELGSSEYNKRRSECNQGVSIIKESLPNVIALRDVSMEQLKSVENSLPEVIFKRCRHVISENERVIESMKVLREHDILTFGELVNASHDSLRNDYKVSCYELDTMVNIAREIPGIIGARMTGGGFGGCTVNLVKVGEEKKFCKTIEKKYYSSVGRKPELYVCVPSQGVHELT